MPRALHTDLASASGVVAAAMSTDEEQEAMPTRRRKRRAAAAVSSDSDASSEFDMLSPIIPTVESVTAAAAAATPAAPAAAAPASNGARSSRASGPASPAAAPAAAAAASSSSAAAAAASAASSRPRRRLQKLQKLHSSEDEEDNGESTPARATPARAAPARASSTRGAAAAAVFEEEDDEEEEQNGEAEVEMSDYAEEEEEEEEAPAPRGRDRGRGRASYQLREGRGRTVLSPSTSSAMQRLVEDRKKTLAAQQVAAAAAAAAVAESNGQSKRRRLFGTTGAAAAAASSMHVDPEAVKADKYARAESIIHHGDTEEDDDDGVEDTSKYFEKIKKTYDPIAEDKELARKARLEEAELADAKAQEARKKAALEEGFARFQEREAKKRNAGRVGKGSATHKPDKEEGSVASGGSGSKKKKGRAAGAASAASKARKRETALERRERLEELQGYSDDGDFIVPDGEVEEEAAAAARSGEEGEDDDEEEPYEGPRFDEEMYRADEQADQARLEAAMTTEEAFAVWARYHCIVLFDEEYSGIVEREPVARARFYAAQKVIEEPFNLRTEQWVHSATWDRGDCAAIHDRMRSLAYTQSAAPSSEMGCEVCLPKKGHSHQAMYKLTYYGVPYNWNELRHPFKEQRIVLSNTYASEDFNVGQLCHQRLRLYHAMKHFKLHVMLSLKSRLKKLSTAAFHIDMPSTKRQCYKLVDALFGKDVRYVHHQMDIWSALNDAAQGYSIRDTRKTHVDLAQLSEFQNFDAEECLLDLFNWRGIEAGVPFDSAAQMRQEDQDRERRLAKEKESNRAKQSGAGGNRRNGGAYNEDEYELDEEAEAEGEAAERALAEEEAQHEERRRKRAGGSGGRDRRERERESNHAAPAAAAAAASSSAAAPAVSSWRRKGASSSSAMDGSADSIEDLTSEPEDAAPSLPSSARKRAATLPLSRVSATSPSAQQQHQQRPSASNSPQHYQSPPPLRSSPAAASGKLALLTSSRPSAALDRVDSLVASYSSFTDDEKLNFLQAIGATTTAGQSIAFSKATAHDVQVATVENLKEIHELM